MTSTNDGSNLRSGQKDKRYYIESFQSLEARLNGPASTEQRTQNVCEAWRLVYGLCSHSTPDTRSHLLSWIQRNTAYAILQDEWGLPENKPKHVELEKAINDFILECHETDTLLVWETTLLRRAVWYKSVLSNPWGHAVLKALLDPKGVQPTDQEVIGWLREERAMMFVTRLRVMARAKRLIDLALVLVSAIMTRARRVAPSPADCTQANAAPGVQGGSKTGTFVETLSREAGFTKDVWELLIDIEFVLLHKQDQSTCIDLAKTIPLKDGKRIVERLRFRLEKSPADKKLWKKAKDVAILIAQVVITRCMVVSSCTGAVLDALTGCASALAQMLDGSRLPQAAAALAAPAASAAHLYAFADAIAHQCKDIIDRQPFICEFYVRAITAGMNELERLKLEKDKEPEVCALQHTLSGWFTQLGEVLSTSARLRCECLLTAFSLHPSATMYELVAALPPLATPNMSPKRETSEVTSEFGSWATDSRTSSNFVKTSETLKLKQTQKQTNILSSSMFDTECGALGLKSELCEDLAVLLSGPRVKTLSWDMERETLLENCRLYKERTQEGTRALTTELKYLNLDPKSYDHLPEEEDDEDNYYGIEKGYEVSLEYEDIWSDNNIDYTERSESACSISTVDSSKTSTKPRNRKNPVKYYDDEIDPLSIDTEVNCNQSSFENSKNSGLKQNEVIKKKTKSKKADGPDTRKLSDQEKELQKKQKRKERRERKKREKMEMLLKQELKIGMDGNTTNLSGTKTLSAGIKPVKEKRKPKNVIKTQHVSATDSDYDSQGKSSLASVNSEGNDTNDVLFDGLFSMDEIRSPEKTPCKNLSAACDTSKEETQATTNKEKQEMVTDKLKKLLQFRHQKKQTDSTSNRSIFRPEGIKPQVQVAPPNFNTFKSIESEKLYNLNQSDNFYSINASNRNVPTYNIDRKAYVAPIQKQAFSGAQASTSGLHISDPHQKQFQEFLKLQNAYNVRRQNQLNATKVIPTVLAQRNPVLTGLIQQAPELRHNVNPDINNEPGCSTIVSNSKVLNLQQQNLPTVETKKHLKVQKRGVDNVPNTFSRLSYMHKNKQADMKYKQSNEQEQLKTEMPNFINNDFFVKINNLQSKGEILISKANKRNSLTVNRDNLTPLIRQGERIPNPSTSTAMHTKDLRLNIVNVSKLTKEIVENKVIIKKDPKTAMPVDLRYIINQTNLDVGNNCKSQYPNTLIEKPKDVSPLNIGNLSHEDKAVAPAIAYKEMANDTAMQQDTNNKVIVSHQRQFNSKDDSIETIHKEGELENSEDWKFVMNKLRSLKSAKKTIDALEMTLKSNANIKGRAEILRNLHKYALGLKDSDSRDHMKIPLKQKVRTSVNDSKPNVIKNEVTQKSNQPSIVKKLTKKAVTKCNDITKPVVISKTLKTSNVLVPPMHNYDYDQLDDLIDDELRQEIEESSPMNSEVDIYGPARRALMLEKAKLPKTTKSQEVNSVQSNKVNYNKELSSGQSSMEGVLNPLTRTCSVIKENTHGSTFKPKLHIISDQILPSYSKSSDSKTEKIGTKSDISENRSSVIAELPISKTQKILCKPHSNINNMSIITSPINVVHPANVILRNVSHVNQVQNLTLITPTKTILCDTNHPTPIVEQQLPVTSKVNNQTSYVLKTQNTSLLSLPPNKEHVANPIIMENATTKEAPNKSSISDHHLCRNDVLTSNVSKEYISEDKGTEVVSKSNAIRHELYMNTKINNKIESNRLKEEIIQSHSIHQNAAEYCGEILKSNLMKGKTLLKYPNHTRDCNIDIINQHIIEKRFQRADNTSSTNKKNDTEFKHPNHDIISVFPEKNEFPHNAEHIPKCASYGESKYDRVATKTNETVTFNCDVIDSKQKNINKKEEGSHPILSDSCDHSIESEFTTDVEREITKTEMDYINKEKEKSPSIPSKSCAESIIVNFTTDVGRKISKTETDQENMTDCKVRHKENGVKLCVEEKLETDVCSKSDKRSKLEVVVYKPQVVKILNDTMESKLNTEMVTDNVFENENNLVAKVSRTKSYNSDLSQNHNMSVTIYIPPKKIFESSTVDDTTKLCERKVLSQVQEKQLAKAELTENKKNLKNKHFVDNKLSSDKEIERLKNKRLSIIHREINHYIVSEPIALMYAPIDFEKSIRSHNISSSSQKIVTGIAEQRLNMDSKGNETSKIENAEISSPNSEHIMDKSNHLPTRRLRSSNLFRISKCTPLKESKLDLPTTEQHIGHNNTNEAKKFAPKRILENQTSMDNSIMKIQKNELCNISRNFKDVYGSNTNKRQDEVTRNSNIVHSAADTIDLTDTEFPNSLQTSKKVSDSFLNTDSVETVKNTSPLDRSIENARKLDSSVQKICHQPVQNISQDNNKNILHKEVTVSEIKELQSPTIDGTKKILRIKLSNGNIFRATVSGNLKVDIKTILSEPSIKSLLTTNILQRKSCTVNVKHITDIRNCTSKNEVTISNVFKKLPDLVSTDVIELSDDDDENIYYFKTEFGTYKAKSIDSKTFEKHQNKFAQKCTVKIERQEINFHNIISKDDDCTVAKMCDVTNKCGTVHDEVVDNCQIKNDMDRSEINSGLPPSKTESISCALEKLPSSLLESQIAQLHNICRVNLARCDQLLKTNDCCINSASGLKELKMSANKKDNGISNIRSIPVSLLSDATKLDQNTSRSESSSLFGESLAKRVSILPSYDQNVCNSDWILCTKSMIYSLETKIIIQKKNLQSVHDCRVQLVSLEDSKINNSFSNSSGIEQTDNITLRPESPSIIADFEAQAKQNSYLRTFDQSFCNSDWMSLTKAAIHNSEVNYQKYLKAALDYQVDAGNILDSSTDCDSDFDFRDIRQKNEEEKVIFKVPSLLSLVYTFITSNMDVLERYIIQKNKNSDVFNSPTHNLKRKHNMSDKRNNCKISRTDGNKSCVLNVPLLVANKEYNNKHKNMTARELERPTMIIETMIQHKKHGVPNYSNKWANEANLNKTIGHLFSVSKVLCDVDSNKNNNNHNLEENVSNLEFEKSKESSLPNNNKHSRETFTIKNNSNINQLELSDVDSNKNNNNHNLEENVSNLEFEKSKESSLPNQESENSMDIRNEVPSQIQDIEEGKILKNPTIVETITQYTKDKMPAFFNDKSIDTNVVSVISVSKELCETDSYKNLNNHECVENISSSELEVSEEEHVTLEKSSKLQLSNNKKELKLPNFATLSANESNFNVNEDNFVPVSKMLCDADSSNNVANHNCERNNLMDNNIPESNIFLSSMHSDKNIDKQNSIDKFDDQILSTDVKFKIEKNKNNEDTKLNTLEIATYQDQFKSIPLTVSENSNKLKLEHNVDTSQEVFTNEALCFSEKMTQKVDFDEKTHDENENKNTNPTKLILSKETCTKINKRDLETQLKFTSGQSDLNHESKITTEYATCDIKDDTLDNKKYFSLVTADLKIHSEKLLKPSKCMKVATLEGNNLLTESYSNNIIISTSKNSNETNTTDKDPSNASEKNDTIFKHQLTIITDSVENIQKVNKDSDIFCRNPSSVPKQCNEVAKSYVNCNNSIGSSLSSAFFLKSEKNNSTKDLHKKHPDGDENTLSISENQTIMEKFTDNDSKKVDVKKLKNENESVTLIYKGNSNVVLKGSPYVDPVVGTCYIFPLTSSRCSRNEFTTLNANQKMSVIKSFKKKSLNDNEHDMLEQSNFSLILPKITYSRFHDNQCKNGSSNTKQLKRKSDTKNDCKLEKKYRKGKNIDTCKQTTEIFAKIAYADQYKRLLEYCTTIKFSYSRPFHKNSIDTTSLLKNWPIQDVNYNNYSPAALEDSENLMFLDIDDENKTCFDPLQQTLAEEISMDYNHENEYPQISQIEDSNFNMGFGEGSGRVIQNLANGIYTSKFSAATLSDVKLPQPSPTTAEDKKQNIPQIIKKSNDEELANMKRCISFIQLRDKVKDFFRKSASELHHNFNMSKRSSKSMLCDLTNTQFFYPPKQVTTVNVVQVGQLPVSASAQNPVTCDPRVTHVSNASPPQCSAENSPDGDQNANKTEYTELTTADLTLPHVQEYQQSSQVIMSSQSQLSVPVASKVSMDSNCESKLEQQEEVVANNENTEVPNNFIPEHKNTPNISYSFNSENDSFKSGNNSYKSMNESYKSENDTYKSDSIHKTEKKICKPESNALQSENSRTLDIESQNAIFDSLLKDDNEYSYKAKTTNGTSEKTDQIAHAMNAAGITTGTDSISNNNRAHALVNILSQKMRQNTVNTTQTSVNSYTKGSPINAMALQQALAQILPPPLNQTNSSDHQNTSITPQVLHIVQGKNSSGNQITIVDNQQNSVINNTSNTPVLHIVQNKSAIGSSASNSNNATQNNNSFSGLSLVDAGIQQGGNQLLHIVNTGQKNSTSGQLLKRVNLLTNLTNVQGSNEQKMVQFVCKSADGKSIQLNGPHQRSMVLRLQPIESTNVPNAAKSEGQDIIQSPNFISTKDNNNTQQQEIKSRSVYEENYAKFIQNSSPKPSMPEKSTSLPKFNQAFGKQVFQDNNQKNNEIQSNSTSHVANTNSSTENVECSSNDNTINLEHINQINSPPLLLRKSPAQTSQSQQSQSNLVQQIKQTMAPVNIQTMHGGVIYTRQIPVNIGGGQTINLITVPSTELVDETGQKQQGEVKFVNQNEIEPSIIKIVPQSQNSSTSEGASEDSNALNATNDTPHTTTATHTQPVLTQMRIKLPMLSKTPQMVSGARLVRPSFFQIQRNVIGGANQPVYQQLVLTAAPPLGQQTVRPPQAQPTRVKTTTDNQTSSESQMSTSTLEQLREFDMVLEQVKERSTVQPNSNTNNTYTKLQSPTEATGSNSPTSVVTTEPTQQVLYSIGNNNSLNVAYVNRKPGATTPATSTFARSPDSSGVADSPTSSTHVQIPAPSSSNETSSDTSPQQSLPKQKSSSKSKNRPKTSSNPTTSMKINTVPPKTSTQKPLEDEQTTQRILYILAEYKEQVENSPDKDKPAPRRRSNPPSNPGSSKRKKSSSGSRRPGRDMSPIHGEDTCRTMGSEDSSCGTSQGDCTENCLESHSPQDSPRKVVRKLTFENETPNATPRQQPARNVIVADGQTITVARGTAGKPATAVLMPANYILPVSMVKGGQQIAIVTNRGPKILTVGGEGGGNALLLQRLIGPAGLKPVLARPGVRHVRLPTAALHNLQAFNIATAANVQPPDSTASPAPAGTPPDLVETRATSSPWPDRDSQDVKPERSSSPEGSEPWNLPSSADPHDYSYEETVRAENLDRTVLDAIPDRYSPDLEAQRIFDKMFDVDTKKSYIDSQDNSPRCGYDIDASDCDDKAYQQVVQKRDQRQHRLAHVSAAALRHKYAILEHELRLQKSLSEECEDLGVDSPSASELFPEAELLFASSPAHESSHHGHTPQPGISQSTIPQPDMDDQIATDQLLNRTLQDDHQDLDVTLGLDEGIVTVSEDGMQATITLDQEEFARSHPNTTFHSEPTEEENIQPYTVSGIKGRHITSTIFHAGRAPATVLMTAPQTTVISQAMPEQQHTNIKYIDNIMNPGHNNICLSSVLVKDDGLTKYDNILNDSRELHLSNTASAIVHSNTTQVIRRVCYDDDKRDSRFLLDETDALIAGDDAKMIAEDSSRDATLESIADDRSSPERHTELFWESNSASERSDSRRPLDFSSDSDKCCKSPLYDETNSTDSSGVGAHMRLDSVIKDARGLDRSGSADNSSADDTLPPLRTYPPKRMYHVDGEMERSVSGKTRAGERSPDGHEVRRRASVRGVVKRGCHCCNGSPAPPRPKKSRQKKPSIDFNN